MSQQLQNAYQFGPFCVDAVRRVLLREGEMIPVTSKCLDTLLVLVEHRGQVVTKDYLMKTLWPDTVVEENNLTQQISMLRKVLGERVGEHRYLVTVPGRGYSFVAEVSAPPNGDRELIVAEHIRSRITLDVEDESDKEFPESDESVKYLPQQQVIKSRLSRFTLAVLSILILIAGSAFAASWFLARQPQPASNDNAHKSIAVLPFKALTDDSKNDYLTTGMADALIAKLSNVRQISVRPTSAIVKYTGQDQDAQEIGKRLGVDSVLEGTVQSAGNRVRVTVQLVNVQNRTPLWAKTFDEELTDIFALQNTISEQVAQALMVKLNGDEQKQIRKHETYNVEAYQEYLRGRYFWNKRNEEGLTKSLSHFQQAIELDPGYGAAYAGSADAQMLLVFYHVNNFPATETIQNAKASAVKALEIDETLAEAHTSLGLIKSRYDRDYSGAETEFKRAIQLNPNYATVHHWYSEHLVMMGRDDEAMKEIELAQELDPLSPVINTTLGERLYYARRYDEAIAQLRKTLEIEPTFRSAHYALGLAFEQKGLFDQAISEFEKAQGKGTDTVNLSASLGHTYAVAGQQIRARKILKELLSQRTKEPYEIALVYQGLGDTRQVIEWLKKIKDGSDGLAVLLRLDPRLDKVRSEPQLQGLM